jgi:hypothetical protein
MQLSRNQFIDSNNFSLTKSFLCMTAEIVHFTLLRYAFHFVL